MFELREIKSETEYKLLELSPDAPFTEAWFFGQWQEMAERKVRRFKILNDSETLGIFQMIKYSLPFGQSFLYIPHGPVLRSFGEGGDPFFNEFLEKFYKKLVEIAKKENAIFARLDFYYHYPNYGSKKILYEYFKKTPDYAYHSSYFQPKSEWILDLEKSEEEILNNMRPKTRYNIGLAERRGVEVDIISENFNGYFDSFYELLKQTANRDNFNLHPKNYYQNIFIKCAEDKNAFLVVARYGGKILAMNLILLFGNTAYFLLGGSSGEQKNLMAPHIAHWEAIKEAKNRGLKFYNFGAINIDKFSAQDGPASSWEGISRFKKGFGGQILEYSDSYDLVLKSFWYALYRFSKSIRQTLHFSNKLWIITLFKEKR